MNDHVDDDQRKVQDGDDDDLDDWFAENINLSKLCVAQLGKHGLKGRLERVDFLIKMQDQIANLDHIYDIDFAEIADLGHIDDIDYAELILIIMNMLILLILMMI